MGKLLNRKRNTDLLVYGLLGVWMGQISIVQASESFVTLPEPHFGDSWLQRVQHNQASSPEDSTPLESQTVSESESSLEFSPGWVRELPEPIEPQAAHDLPFVTVPQSFEAAILNTLPDASEAQSLGLGYRVLADASTEASQVQVKRRVPGAFRTQVDGEVWLQVGAFADRGQAEALQRELRGYGLKVWLQEL